MKCVFLITSKPFAFSTFEVAKKFREEYSPLVETKIGASSHLSLPDNRCKIVPTLEDTDVKVYDTIEECLRDYPHEKFFKYANEVKKIKAAILLKTPLVFDNHERANNRVVLRTYKVNYEILKDVVKRGNENLQNVEDIDDPNTVITKVQLNGKGKVDPVATINLKQFKEMQSVLAKTEEKLKALKESVGYILEDQENEL